MSNYINDGGYVAGRLSWKKTDAEDTARLFLVPSANGLCLLNKNKVVASDQVIATIEDVNEIVQKVSSGGTIDLSNYVAKSEFSSLLGDSIKDITDPMNSRISNLENKYNSLNNSISIINNSLSSMRTTLNNHEQRISANETSITRLRELTTGVVNFNEAVIFIAGGATV